MKQGINLHIEELILNGFDPTDHYRIGDAVQGELSKLLEESGYVPTSDSEVPDMSAPVIRMAEHADPCTVGREVARSVFRSLPIASQRRLMH